jgi:phage-related protein
VPKLIKPVEFIGTSLEDLRDFPRSARREAGFQIDRVQEGGEPFDWKPMPGVGRGVCEIRIRAESGAYRVIYFARLEFAVFVLHCFQKKTQRTSAKDIDFARLRYKELMERLRRIQS